MDNRFKKILSEHELQNESFVKEYLEVSFKRRTAMKSTKLYTNLANIYYHYPKLIKNIIKNINTLGYYKDIFHILSHDSNNKSTNTEESLEKYIYRIVRDQLVSDVQNMKNNKTISTMGKWLPRENGGIDKKIKFVEKFGQYYFPNVHNINEVKKAYRKLKTNLNIVIGTIECHLSSKQYNKMDFNKVSTHALKKNLQTLLGDSQTMSEYKQHLIDTHKNMSLPDFVKSIFSKDHAGIEYMDEVFKKSWKTCSYNFIINNPKLSINNKTVCFVDLNRTMYDRKSDLAIGIALVVDSLSKIKSNTTSVIYVDNVNVVLDGNIRQKAQQIQTAMTGGMRDKNIETLCTMIKKTFDEYTNMIIVSDDTIEHIDTPSINYVQVSPMLNGYEIRKYNSVEVISNIKNVPTEYNIKNITRTGVHWGILLMFIMLLVGVLVWIESMKAQNIYYI